MEQLVARLSDGRESFVEVRGVRLHLLRWDGDGVPFLLVHGLASNARTWEGVAAELSEAGHPVVAVNQRGHGLSDKPEQGYDFSEVTADLEALIQSLDFTQPLVLAGQSWGGNVALDFAVRYPRRLRGLVLVDGGFIELGAQPDATWERVSRDMRPPPLAGLRYDDIAARLRTMQPEWSEAGVQATMGNFERFEDGTIRPWLSLDRHLQILRALWEHRPSQLYARVEVPTLMAVAATDDETWTARKRAALAIAESNLPNGRVVWFEQTAHDIHVHRPGELARLMLDELREGRFQ